MLQLKTRKATLRSSFMQSIGKGPICYLQALLRYFLIPTSEPVTIDELVRKQHDVLVHSVLVCELDDGLGMGIRQQSEERDV
jgi:hypothetical protein